MALQPFRKMAMIIIMVVDKILIRQKIKHFYMGYKSKKKIMRKVAVS